MPLPDRTFLPALSEGSSRIETLSELDLITAEALIDWHTRCNAGKVQSALALEGLSEKREAVEEGDRRAEWIGDDR